MSKFQVAYFPIGVPTFDLESAQVEFDKSVQLLTSLSDNCVCPNKMLLSMDLLQTFCDTVQPNLIVLQNITFANSAYASEILNRFSCPVILWTLREPVIDGGRLRLNSLTGAYSAATALHAFGNNHFDYVFGSPEESEVRTKLSAAIGAVRVKCELKHLKMASIGHTPQGFGFGRALDADMLSVFGVTLDSIEARELIERAKSYTNEECRPYLDEAIAKTVGMDATPTKNVDDFARLYKAYADYIKENGIGALSSRCWPDFFTVYGTPVCAVLSLLNENGIAAACESDTYGALSMYIGLSLSGKPTFFGDPVSLDETLNTITYWHCGTAACSLARNDTGAVIGTHCNRKIGPTMDFGCKPCEAVTVFRVGRIPNGGFRLFIMGGKALDMPKQFNGTSVVVQPSGNAKSIVCSSVEQGWEPHFVVVYGDIRNELVSLGKMLGLELCIY